MKFTAGRGWGSALDKPFSLQYCFVCQQRSLIHELAADEIKFASTVRHASTKHFGFGNLLAISWRRFYFTRVEKILSSRELITAARVVQKSGRWSLASEQ